MGSDRTSQRELERYGNQLLGSYLRGVYPMDEQPGPDGSKHCCIVNVARTAEESAINGHWILLMRDGKDELLYDSFGREVSEFAPSLEGIATTEDDAEQPKSPDVEWCGQACIAVAVICKQFGLSVAKQI